MAQFESLFRLLFVHPCIVIVSTFCGTQVLVSACVAKLYWQRISIGVRRCETSFTNCNQTTRRTEPFTIKHTESNYQPSLFAVKKKCRLVWSPLCLCVPGFYFWIRWCIITQPDPLISDTVASGIAKERKFSYGATLQCRDTSAGPTVVCGNIYLKHTAFFCCFVDRASQYNLSDWPT